MFNNIMTEVVEHNCLICNEKVLQTVNKLMPHFSRFQFHGQLLGDPYKKLDRFTSEFKFVKQSSFLL